MGGRTAIAGCRLTEGPMKLDSDAPQKRLARERPLARARLLDRWPHLLALPPTEGAIIRRWTESGPPVVTIICSTFNQSELIGDALHGFLTQRTSFPFEIVLRDDASTDGTQQIIHDFAQRYPRIIRVVLHKENRYIQGIFPVHGRPALISGEYAALCDGDDFWVDPEKLQRQVDQLRRNPQIVLSTGGTLHFSAKDSSSSIVGEVETGVIYPDHPPRYHHTSTYVFRSKPYIDVIQRYMVPRGLYGDTVVRSLIMTHGKIAAVTGILSVYYIDGGGMWTRMDGRQQAETHVHIYATLVRVLPWRRRVKALRPLALASRTLVELRFPSSNKVAHANPKRGIPPQVRRLLQWYRKLALIARALWGWGPRTTGRGAA